MPRPTASSLSLGAPVAPAPPKTAQSTTTTPEAAAAQPVWPGHRLTIRLGRVMTFLWLAVAVAILLSLVQDLLIFLVPEAGFTDRIYRLDLDTEASLPTWLSSGLMLVCALTLLAIGVQARRHGLVKALPWLLLSAAFFFLSLDESISLHEWLSAAIAARVDNTGIFYFVWAVPALVLCIAGLACFLPFILGFKGTDRALLVGSAVVFLAGAVGVEMLGGMEAEAAGIETLRYRLLSTLEETLEFSGLLLFLLFLLRRLREDHNRLTIYFK